jgi:glutaryl-CoA dehydrogenase
VDGELLNSEVLPVINGYWERAEFPWPLIKKLAKLRMVCDGIDRYGCSPMSPIAAGLVNMELNLALEILGTPGRRRVGERRASPGITCGEGHARL